jgi:carbamoyltransferase
VPVRILGLSAYYHDAAASLVVDGEIVAAAQEERFTRKKHDPGFPRHAVAYCLREGGIGVGDLDHVGFYEKPIVKFERLLDTYFAYAPRGLRSFLAAMPVWLGEKLWLSDAIKRELGYAGTIRFGDHHESHAASAFYPSPFEEAAVLTMDAVGEWATSSIGFGRGNDLTLLKEMRFPHSLGMLYSAFTYFTGFKVNSGEYKVMGLAPYGEPRYASRIRDHLVDLKEDGSLELNMAYFDYARGLRMTGAAFERLFDGPARAPESPLTQREMDLARSIQEVTEEAMLRMARTVHRETGLSKLCLAGGVALNCVGNGRILREGPFEELWVQPAAGDAGGSLGVALALWHRYLGRPRVSAQRRGLWQAARKGAGARAVAVGAGQGFEAPRAEAADDDGPPPYHDEMKGAFLGPAFSDEEIGAWLAQRGYPARRLERARLAEAVAQLLAEERVVGLLQGRMEFGPRALGGRSILGDARSPKMQSLMNLKIKYRESFRPFAPSVLREHAAEWFELDAESPYMLLVAPVARERCVEMSEAQQRLWGIEKLNVPRSEIPAVTHVDYSARVQTVRREANPFFHDILRAFHALTGCPVLINTSFNVRGEPIVCTPEDAYRCFMRTEMDALVLETYLLDKAGQPPFQDRRDWRREFVLD